MAQRGAGAMAASERSTGRPGSRARAATPMRSWAPRTSGPPGRAASWTRRDPETLILTLVLTLMVPRTCHA